MLSNVIVLRVLVVGIINSYRWLLSCLLLFSFEPILHLYFVLICISRKLISTKVQINLIEHISHK